MPLSRPHRRQLQSRFGSATYCITARPPSDNGVLAHFSIRQGGKGKPVKRIEDSFAPPNQAAMALQMRQLGTYCTLLSSREDGVNIRSAGFWIGRILDQQDCFPHRVQIRLIIMDPIAIHDSNRFFGGALPKPPGNGGHAGIDISRV